MNLITKFLDALLKFRAAREAVAAVEFALILPVMLVLYLGSIEVSQVVSVDRKMAAAAGTLGDLVAQSDGSISASTLNDYFQAVGLTMSPYPDDNLKQLVTVVYVDINGATSVTWSVGYNGATAKAVNAAYTLPTQITAISRDAYVVVSEAQISYQPWGGYVLDTSINLYKQFFHLPRFGGLISLV